MMTSIPTPTSGSGEQPTAVPIEVVPPDPSWPGQYDELAERIRCALGDQVLALEHVG